MPNGDGGPGRWWTTGRILVEFRPLGTETAPGTSFSASFVAWSCGADDDPRPIPFPGALPQGLEKQMMAIP
jgi:hypothetical protein